MRLTDKDYWDSSYADATYFYDFKEHAISQLLIKYLGDGKGKQALEIGSFPGSFIPTIGRKGYTVNGVDFNDKNSSELPKWLKTLQLNVGEFYSKDFFEFVNSAEAKYDLVCSFGFIEHFQNYEQVLLYHMKMVKPGGKLVITAPNFRGWMQFVPHYLLDKPNLAKHFLPSMNPTKWKRVLEKQGFEVEFADYFGGYGFWIDKRAPKGTLLFLVQRLIERIISQLRKVFSSIKVESAAFSCLCGVVATKKR